ncbi:hypothetical protein GCM10010420_24650 [Streptomyces glaucosporus]|uniref:DUF4190 domain-containing protein n=1 Tax=Streptomyces glaucosporus TaxID=284044 RepID=A0ABP5VDJ8_9ACTN
MTPEQHPNVFAAPDPYRHPHEAARTAPWGGAAHGGYGWAPPPRPRNGLGLAALVTGAVGAGVGMTVVLSPLGVVLGAVAMVLGVLGLRRVRTGAADNRGQAMAGLWTGAGATLVSAALSVVLVLGVAGMFDFVEVSSDAGTADIPAVAGETVVYDDGLTVVAAEAAVEPGPEEARVVLTLTLANDGRETADLRDGDLEIYLDGSLVPAGGIAQPVPAPAELAPGARATVELALQAPEDTGLLGLDYAPGLDYDYGFWEFDLPGGDGTGETGGQDGEPDEVTAVSL